MHPISEPGRAARRGQAQAGHRETPASTRVQRRWQRWRPVKPLIGHWDWRRIIIGHWTPAQRHAANQQQRGLRGRNRDRGGEAVDTGQNCRPRRERHWHDRLRVLRQLGSGWELGIWSYDLDYRVRGSRSKIEGLWFKV
jgi:hypothetical protein